MLASNPTGITDEFCRSAPPVARYAGFGALGMLSKFGFSLVSLMGQLRESEEALERVLRHSPNAIAPTWTANPNTAGSLSQTEIAIRVARSLSEQLGLKSTNAQTMRLMRIMVLRKPLSEFLSHLQAASLLFVPSELAANWNKDDQFGLGEKFKDAQQDIKDAANCLAIGQGTACVFHLMRAMEVAVRKLGRRQGLTVTPQSTWRQMTATMDNKIQSMPQNTQSEKRKKNNWEAARANLHHVGSVWRNNTMHPASSYTPAQARDIFSAVRVFMVALAEL